MFSKTRTMIVTAVASVSFATAAVAPAVSQAQKNINPKTKAAACELFKQAAGIWQEQGELAESKGETDNAAYYFSMRDKVEGEAGNMGCLWEIEIDATKVAVKVKAIKVPGATVPVQGTTKTSTSTTTVSPVSAK